MSSKARMQYLLTDIASFTLTDVTQDRQTDTYITIYINTACPFQKKQGTHIGPLEMK